MKSIKLIRVILVALTVAKLPVAQSQNRALQLPDIRVGMAKDVALAGLRANHEVMQVPSPGIDAWYIDGKGDQGQINFVQNRVASVSQHIGGTYTDASTITFVRDLYRVLRLYGRPAPDGKRRANLEIEFSEVGIPGFGSSEHILFKTAPGRHIMIGVILPDKTTEGAHSVTLSTFRNVP